MERPRLSRDDRASTAILLVSLYSAVELLFGLYGIVTRTIQDHNLVARHGGWQQPIALGLLLFFVWFYSLCLLVPAAALGAAELARNPQSHWTRAVMLGRLMCAGIGGELWASQLTQQTSPVARGLSASWLHDGRLSFALMCLLAMLVLAGAIALLRPVRASPAALRHAATVA